MSTFVGLGIDEEDGDWVDRVLGGVGLGGLGFAKFL